MGLEIFRTVSMIQDDALRSRGVDREMAGEVTGRQDLRAEVDACGLFGILHNIARDCTFYANLESK